MGNLLERRLINIRIWDLPVEKLCNKHLLGEHRELHCIFTFLTTDKGGSYKKHPETLRWVDKLPALYNHHEQQVKEINKRGWKHKSELPFINGAKIQNKFINTIEEQIEILKNKKCLCFQKSCKI